jgi:hypothetical protein
VSAAKAVTARPSSASSAAPALLRDQGCGDGAGTAALVGLGTGVGLCDGPGGNDTHGMKNPSHGGGDGGSGSHFVVGTNGPPHDAPYGRKAPL